MILISHNVYIVYSIAVAQTWKGCGLYANVFPIIIVLPTYLIDKKQPNNSDNNYSYWFVLYFIVQQKQGWGLKLSGLERVLQVHSYNSILL